MIGGCDGVKIVDADPFNMSVRANCLGPDATTANSYAYASVDRAIEMIRNPEAVEMKLAAMPGITNKNLTAKLIQICEARADALAIIDLPNVFKPEHEAFAENFEARVTGTSASKSAKDLIRRRINSSYGCAYYPWVQIRDTIDGSPVWVPPSVLALGTMAYTEQRDEVWFAPAGFNRGGLNEGNAGLPVLQVSEQLLSKDRDILYDANINPIASFVSEGIVIFGQKTLQSTKSALDRINVRRLLIFVKREVSRVSNTLLFDNNLPATWNRFKSLVVPMLESVKTRLGLADFKVVLDETTTTSDLVDRNVMYAKIFLKPARAIEFIAVDFVITRSGASFK
jgi:phage tail sheath protein FI